MTSSYWREEYDALPASIGGAEFHVDGAKTQLGRRNAIQRFPGTARVRSQDLGPEADAFDVEGYIIGRDYHQKRAALEAVFRTPGTHLLVHPYRGRMRVAIEGQLSISESKARGGVATISFRVIRVIDEDLTLATRNAGDELARKAALASINGPVALGAVLTTLDRPESLSSFQAAVASAQTALNRVRGSTLAAEAAAATASVAVAGLPSRVSAAVANPSDAIGQMTSTVRLVLDLPRSAVATTGDLWSELSDGSRLAALFGMIRSLVRGGADGLPVLTERAVAEASIGTASATVAAAQAAQVVTAAVRTEAAAALADALVALVPESRTQAREAIELLDRVIVGDDGSDDSLLFAVDEASFTLLSDLRAAAVRHLGDVSIHLPELRTYTPPMAVSALLLAHRLYGDARRWTELVERNHVMNPVFVPAGVPVEYIRAT